jgi:dihydroorotate dehydrogenase
MVHKVYQKTQGRLPIVACGGIGCDPLKHPAEEAWEYLNLGASLVQLHTGLIYQGPAIARIINTGLANILKTNHIASLADWLATRDERS